MACSAWKLFPPKTCQQQLKKRRGIEKTYVPCLPVKPWKSTRVSAFMRRLWAVDAYAELAPTYVRRCCCLEAFCRAESVLRRMACMAAEFHYQKKLRKKEKKREKGWEWSEEVKERRWSCSSKGCQGLRSVGPGCKGSFRASAAPREVTALPVSSRADVFILYYIIIYYLILLLRKAQLTNQYLTDEMLYSKNYKVNYSTKSYQRNVKINNPPVQPPKHSVRAAQLLYE